MKIRREIGERIAAGIVVVLIAADESAEREDGIGIDQPRPRRRDVEGLDLRALVGWTNQIAIGIEAAVVHGQSVPRRREFGVVGIGGLEPRPGESEIQVNGVRRGDLKVDAIEQVLFIAFVMEDGELRRIEKAAAIQSVRGDEVAPLLASVAEVNRPTFEVPKLP